MFRHLIVRVNKILGALLLCLLPLLMNSWLSEAIAQVEKGHSSASTPVKRVLLLSIDGMHAIDLADYVRDHPESTLAQLTKRGITYSNAQTSLPSNSWPGLLAIVTGGSPLSTGVIFENNYDRSLSPPGSNCATVGTAIVYDSSIDKDPDSLDAGGIDPAKLPRDPAKGCRPVYPHDYIRVNNIFEVVKSAGGYTAWADKHPAYDFLNGPSGTGVDDLFVPEIRPVTKARSVPKTEAYDDSKTQAVLNEIAGKDHSGTHDAPVPTVFGMNFQAVSMAQKMTGHGYREDGTPSSGLKDAFDHTDQAIGKMIAALRQRGLLDSTMVIVTAKHGDVPIAPSKLRLANLDLIPNAIKVIDPSLLLNAEQDGSIAMLWLKDHARTSEAVRALRAKQEEARIQQIFWGESLKLLFADPEQDPRMPDIIIQPVFGTIYAEAKDNFIEEHGGFTEEDTHVALLVSLPSLKAQQIKAPVRTAQIAPTILEQLQIDPQRLEAVAKEFTRSLPGLQSPLRTSEGQAFQCSAR